MELTIDPGTRPSANHADGGACGGFGFPDFSEAGASEQLGLMGQADLLRHQATGYLVGLVVRYGELEGPGATSTTASFPMRRDKSAHPARHRHAG